MKPLYKMSTGLWEVCEYNDDFRFESDKEAWDTLRKHLPHKFATLYRLCDFVVPIVNKAHYVEANNSKYIEKMDADQPCIAQAWVPVCKGITDDRFDLFCS